MCSFLPIWTFLKLTKIFHRCFCLYFYDLFSKLRRKFVLQVFTSFTNSFWWLIQKLEEKISFIGFISLQLFLMIYSERWGENKFLSILTSFLVHITKYPFLAENTTSFFKAVVCTYNFAACTFHKFSKNLCIHFYHNPSKWFGLKLQKFTIPTYSLLLENTRLHLDSPGGLHLQPDAALSGHTKRQHLIHVIDCCPSRLPLRPLTSGDSSIATISINIQRF